jgi:hypothetical protein
MPFADVEAFRQFTGVVEEDDRLIVSCLQSASDIIASYLDVQDFSAIPEELLRQSTLRIAALLHSESGQNIGVTSKQFADSGTRTFVNSVNYDKYLIQLSPWKSIRI